MYEPYGGVVRVVPLGPLTGLGIQIALLAVIAGTAGLTFAGWAAGSAYGIVLCVLLVRSLHASAPAGLGPADWVTYTRAALVGCVTALTADSFVRQSPAELLVGIAVIALTLDAVDGMVARRTGTASPFGARFDMEVDAFLILVLCVYVAPAVGGWVLAIGAMRYGYVAASWALRWMRRTLPPRYWRKVVAAVQGIVLVFAAADVLALPLMIAVLAVALTLLIESFGRDIIWLWRQRAAATVSQPEPLVHRRRRSGPAGETAPAAAPARLR